MDAICHICDGSVRNSCSPPCGHFFCGECLSSQSYTTCPVCEGSVLTPLSLKNILKRRRVSCSDCGQMAIPEENLAEHTRRTCPKTTVNCLAAATKCPWTGLQEQLDTHLVTCSFYSLERLVSQLRTENHRLRDQLNRLKEQTELQHRSRTEEIQSLRDNQSISGAEFVEQLIIEESKISVTNSQLDYQKKQIAGLEQQMTIIKSQLHFYQTERERLDQVAIEHKSQIEQLLKKQQIMAGLIGYHNEELIDRLAQCEQRLMKLSEKKLTDRDLFIVVQHAMINKPCELLDLQSNDITGEGIAILADALQNNQTLKTLLLHNNHLSDIGVRYLARVLATTKTCLTTLELESNEITDQGTEELAEMLRTNSTLITLYLSDNRIGDRGVQMLSGALTDQNNTLKELVLDKNGPIGDLGVQALIRMLEKNRSLQTLRLWNCQLSDESKAKLQRIATEKTDFTLIC